MCNFFFCYYVFKNLSAAEASESVYMRERVNIVYLFTPANHVKLSSELEELIEIYKMEKNLQREDSDSSLGSDLKVCCSPLPAPTYKSSATDDFENIFGKIRKLYKSKNGSPPWRSGLHG